MSSAIVVSETPSFSSLVRVYWVAWSHSSCNKKENESISLLLRHSI